MDRAPGLSVRLKLALSYASFLMLAGALLLATVWVFLLRYVPDIPAVAGARSHSGPYHVAVLAGPSRDDLLRAFAPRAAEVLAFLLVFGLVGGWILAGRMLVPLARITDATRKAANGVALPSDRVGRPRRRVPRTRRRLRHDARTARSTRRPAAEVRSQRLPRTAHPSGITQTLLDVARNDSNHDNGELLERLRVVNGRAISLTEALLVLSRADQRSFTRERVDLSLIAEEAAETLLPLAEKHGVTIETSGDVTPTTGSHTLLLQMTTNLLHNAIVHNLPERGAVQVNTAIGPESVMLTVENTGDKLSPKLVTTLTEPFQRGATRIHSDHAGVGLGLAIVKSIAQAHDGTLTLTPRAAGGLCVTVQLPVAPPNSGC